MRSRWIFVALGVFALLLVWDAQPALAGCGISINCSTGTCSGSANNCSLCGGFATCGPRGVACSPLGSQVSQLPSPTSLLEVQGLTATPGTLTQMAMWTAQQQRQPTPIPVLVLTSSSSRCWTTRVVQLILVRASKCCLDVSVKTSCAWPGSVPVWGVF